MKIFVRIILLIIGLLIILFALDFIYGVGIRHNQNIKLTRIRNSMNADILFLGPCEPHWGISPELLKKNVDGKIYNLALNNSDFADNYLHLYHYLKFNKAPRFIFVYVTPASFDERTNVFNSFRFAPYLGDPLIDSVVNEMDPGYFSWSHIPFLKYAYYNSQATFDVFQGFKHYLTDRKEAYYDDGYEPPSEHARGTKDGKLVFSDTSIVRYSWGDERERYLKKLIDLAKAIGSEVVLYESPVYSEAMKVEIDRKRIVAGITRIALTENVRFVQFTNWNLASDPGNFNAPRNLNRKGVELFSDTLGKYLHALVSMKSSSTEAR